MKKIYVTVFLATTASLIFVVYAFINIGKSLGVDPDGFLDVSWKYAGLGIAEIIFASFLISLAGAMLEEH